jgi:KAP family P-loop domain
VKEVDGPVCVFIDDLDRCRADFVVDLLEGIQTSFRHGNVAYVVATDRGWIKASFEARYGGFSNVVGNAGQPLGYLFLEKIFQVSTPVPGMGDKTRSAYWNRLVKGTAPPAQGGQPPDPMSAPSPVACDATKERFDRAVETKREERAKSTARILRAIKPGLS